MRPFRLLPIVALLVLCAPAAGNARSTIPVDAPADSNNALPYVDRIFIHPERPSTVTHVVLTLTGHFPYRCGVVFANIIDREHITLELRPGGYCSESWGQTFPLGLFPAGRNRVAIELTVVGEDATNDSSRSVYHGAFEFFVTDSVRPPPPRRGLPYVEFVHIRPMPHAKDTRQPTPPDRAICPQDSILVEMGGRFPNDCFSLKDVVLTPSPIAAPFPVPPNVGLIVDSTGCVRRLCREIAVEWRAMAVLPPLPVLGPEGVRSADYVLGVAMAVGACLGPGTTPPQPQYFDAFPFTVVRDCSTHVEPCVVGRFEHPNGWGTCDATIAPGRRARVTFDVRSSVALSGLQGEFKIEPPGLRITGMSAVGPATGMHLTWTQTGWGARFVMFAELGAPIPGLPGSPWFGDGEPVLQLELDSPDSITTAAVTLVHSEALFGSDANGQGVPTCLPPPYARIDIRGFSARICRERACDFNADGVADVRDLVRMVHCIFIDGPCVPDSTEGPFDCNGDSTFTLEDVLCCARHVIGEPRCPECPPDTTRHEPSVALNLDVPIKAADGTLSVPLTVRGVHRIGAARFVLDFPSDRYQVTSVERRENAAGWLDLWQLRSFLTPPGSPIRNAQLLIGLIRTEPGPAKPSESVVFTVHLKLRPGQSPGGTLAESESDFSGADGVKLIVDTGRPSQSLGGPARLALSPARPNPFSTETRFSLTLDRSEDLEVGIYDVSGRLVASLHRGRLPAGTREFAWTGRSDNGSTAATGIYWYRAATAAAMVSHKLVLLKRE